MTNRENTLWTEKYRPHVIEDCILPSNTKKFFQKIVDNKDVPMLLLIGSPGTGKTTAARAMCDQIGADLMFINASEENGIDTLRTKIKQFASTVSFSGEQKVVVLDESDGLTPAIQTALKSFTEQFSSNCRFILTANIKNKIIEPLQSRCTIVDFSIPKEERKDMMKKMFGRVVHVLQTENVKYDDKVVAEVIKRHFPDARKVLNELQRYSRAGDGNIDEGILAAANDLELSKLFPAMKGKKFGEVRTWVAEQYQNDPDHLFRKLYEGLSSVLDPRSIPQAVVLIADYQYKAAFVADHEINILALLTEIMSSCDFK